MSGGLGLVMGLSHGRTPSAPVRYIKISGPLWAHGNINDETGINHIIITDPWGSNVASSRQIEPARLILCQVICLLPKKLFFWMNNECVGEDKPTKWLQRGRNMLSMKTTFSFIQEPLDKKTCTWIRNNFSHKGGMHVIKPGQFVRFLSFLFCYTPKWLPPTEGRISTDSQAENNDFWRSRRFKSKKSTKSDTTAFRYYSSNTFAEEKVIVPSSVFQTWSLVPNFSKVTF